VSRLRSLTTGLHPDEPDDDDVEADLAWPPARAYASLLAAAGAGPPPPPKNNKRAAPTKTASSTPSTPQSPPVDPIDPDASSYLDPDGPLMNEMADQLKRVKSSLSSAAFAAAQARRRASGPPRGIVLNAGGPHLLASAIVMLTVLREHLNVTLPVELAWWGEREMDAPTLRALERRFAPLRGYDLSTLAYPSHHRPLRPSEAAMVIGGGGGDWEKGVWGGDEGLSAAATGENKAAAAAVAATRQRERRRRRLASSDAPVLAGTPFDAGDDPDSASTSGYIHDHKNNQPLSLKDRLQKLRNRKNNNNDEPTERGATRRRFAGKVFSLYASRFQRALVLDADCVPLSAQGLLSLFDDPAFLRRGTLFFPDFWAKEESGNRRAAELAGADADASRAALGKGMAGLPGRDTESGQFLIDLNRHADAVEHLWWLNSYPEHTYRAVWGDKDTYAAAFSGAGKAGAFAQSGVPPGGLFAWRPKMLMRSGDGPKDKDRHLDGWMLLGMLQFAPRTGLPLFMHRTIDKFSAEGRGGGGGGGSAAAGGAGAAGAAATTQAQHPQDPIDDSGAAAEREDLLRGDPEHLPPHLRRRYARQHPWPVQLATGPLPGRWVRFFLSHDALGPTKGVPWDYVVPSWSVREWLPFPPAGSAARVVEAGAQGEKEEENKRTATRRRKRPPPPLGGPAFVSDAWQEAGEGLPFSPGADDLEEEELEPAPSRLTCPVATYVAYRRARELGLPVGRNASLDASCRWALRALWGRERWRAFSALGLDERPELMWSAARDPDAAAWSRPAPTLSRGGASMLKPGGGVGGGGRRRLAAEQGAAKEQKEPEQPQQQQQPTDDPAAVYSSAGMFSREVPGPLPVAALRWDYAAPRVDSEPLRALRAAYGAQRALAPGGESYGEFPLLLVGA
jgi:hypothetical protein